MDSQVFDVEKNTQTVKLGRQGVKVRVAGQTTPGLESESLLRNRLFGFVSLLIFGGIIFLVRDIVIGRDSYFVQICSLLMLSTNLAILRSRAELSYQKLRGLEYLSLASVGFLCVYQLHCGMMQAVADEDGTLLMALKHQLISACFALTVIYGLIIPSCPKRNGLISLIITLCLFVLPMMQLGQQEGIRKIAPTIGTLPELSESIAFLILGVGTAMYGSYIQRSLRGEVRDAERLGQYRLTEKIGAGGMGEVWCAEHAFLARLAAIKLIKKSALGDGGEDASTSIQRFEREAQATANLSSPHTITIYDYGTTAEGGFYYAMELLDGVDLATLVHEHGAVPEARAAKLVIQACRSLEEAHSHGMVHRDIKPANIFCCRLGGELDYIKVLDFGLVKNVSGANADPALTRAGAIGTPAFISPESVQIEGTVTPASDIYALGCVLYWLVTGEYVFKSSNAMEIVAAHASMEPLAPSARTDNPVSKDLDDLIMSCLKKDPNDRPGSAKDLAARLDALKFNENWGSDEAERWWKIHRS